jgi:hypothetical protein
VANRSSLEALVPNEGVEATGGTDHDVRALVLGLEEVLVDLDGRSTVEDTGADVGHVLGETGVLVLDLVGELTSVAEDDDRDLAVDGLDLLKSRSDEDGGLTCTWEVD